MNRPESIGTPENPPLHFIMTAAGLYAPDKGPGVNEATAAYARRLALLGVKFEYAPAVISWPTSEGLLPSIPLVPPEKLHERRVQVCTWHEFSDTERKTALGVADGLTDPAIGEALSLSAGTVRNALTSLKAKLEVPAKTRNRIAVANILNGLLLSPKQKRMLGLE